MHLQNKWQKETDSSVVLKLQVDSFKEWLSRVGVKSGIWWSCINSLVTQRNWIRMIRLLSLLLQEWAGMKERQQIAGSKQKQVFLCIARSSAMKSLAQDAVVAWSVRGFKQQPDKNNGRKSMEGSSTQRTHNLAQEVPSADIHCWWLSEAGNWTGLSGPVWLLWLWVHFLPNGSDYLQGLSTRISRTTREPNRAAVLNAEPRITIPYQIMTRRRCYRAHLTSVTGVGWESCAGFYGCNC